MTRKFLATAALLVMTAACSTDPYYTDPTITNAGALDEAPITTGNVDTSVSQYGTDLAGLQQQFANEIGSTVFFATDRYSLSSEARASLASQATWLKSHPNLNITVEGHADERGTREYNLALGERRANAARNYLVSQGVSADSVKTVSYGKERPESLGSTPGSWSKNRRAVTTLD